MILTFSAAGATLDEPQYGQVPVICSASYRVWPPQFEHSTSFLSLPQFTLARCKAELKSSSSATAPSSGAGSFEDKPQKGHANVAVAGSNFTPIVAPHPGHLTAVLVTLTPSINRKFCGNSYVSCLPEKIIKTHSFRTFLNGFIIARLRLNLYKFCSRSQSCTST